MAMTPTVKCLWSKASEIFNHDEREEIMDVHKGVGYEDVFLAAWT